MTDEKPTYEFDNDIIKIKDGKLYVYDEGKVNVKATVSYKGETVTTPDLTVTIAKNPAEKVIEKLESVSVTVKKGEKPSLPKTVKADYNTGLPRDVQVDWAEIDPEQYVELGAFTVYGNVKGTKIKAVATVIVKGPIAVETTTMAVLQNKMPAYLKNEQCIIVMAQKKRKK